MKIVIAYDIADPKRLMKVAKILKDYGTRVQKSIFELELTSTLFSEMKARIEIEIEFSEDGVKFFPLCSKCNANIENFGNGIYIDPDREYYIL